MKRIAPALILVAVLLSACAAGVNPQLDIVPPDGGSVAGFWMGLWHGIITPVTFIISLFTDSVSVYEVHNSGGWYDFGFVLGLTVSVGGGGGGAAKSTRR